jgi:hypothetical protein
MKYGEHLKQNIAPEYGPDPYLQYEKADQIISELTSTKPSRYVSCRVVLRRVVLILWMYTRYRDRFSSCCGISICLWIWSEE